MLDKVKLLIDNMTPENFEDDALKLSLMILTNNLTLSEIKEIQEYVKGII